MDSADWSGSGKTPKSNGLVTSTVSITWWKSTDTLSCYGRCYRKYRKTVSRDALQWKVILDPYPQSNQYQSLVTSGRPLSTRLWVFCGHTDAQDDHNTWGSRSKGGGRKILMLCLFFPNNGHQGFCLKVKWYYVWKLPKRYYVYDLMREVSPRSAPWDVHLNWPLMAFGKGEPALGNSNGLRTIHDLN